MPNFIPYLILIFISALLFVLSWRKAVNKKMIIFYLCIAGFVYYFEFVILVLFKSYKYIPDIFKDSYIDNIFGANVSDGFIVPLAAVFIAVFNLGAGWIVSIVLCFMGIEEFFLYLQIYKQYWWKTIYTGLGLTILLILGKWVWRALLFHTNRSIVRFGALYFANITIQATFLYYFSGIFQVIYYRVHWFNEATRGHIAFEAMYAFVDSIFFALVVVTKASRLWKTMLILCGVAFNLMLHQWGILIISGYWTIAVMALAQICYLFILTWFRGILEVE
jgi:hypothetical protein